MTPSGPSEGASWFGPPSQLVKRSATQADNAGFARLWATFMTARVVFAAALFLLHGALYLATHGLPSWVPLLSAAYLGITVLVRWLARPGGRGRLFDAQWVYSVGVDLAFFGALHLAQPSPINYTPLFALPVLVASVLGSRALGVGSAALVTVLLLGQVAWADSRSLAGSAPDLAQAGLTSAGLLALGWLTNLLSIRLAREEALARASRAEAQLQAVVSNMVIEGLPDGVLVVVSLS